jgi:hypothetical protein
MDGRYLEINSIGKLGDLLVDRAKLTLDGKYLVAVAV